MDRCTENRHVGRRSHMRPKDTLAEVTSPSHNAAEYIELAQLLAMDYPNILTAVAVRNKKMTISFYFMTDVISTDGIDIVLEKLTLSYRY